MKPILRLLWLIGYIPIYALELVVFMLALFIIFPISGAYFFVKTGDVENTPFLPEDPCKWIDKKYRILLNKIEK